MHVTLSPEIETLLETFAQKEGKTKELYAREAILSRLEDAEDYQIAVEASERIRCGEPVFTDAQVRKMLDLDD